MCATSLADITVSGFSRCWIRYWLNRDHSLTKILKQFSRSQSMFWLFSLTEITEPEKIKRATVSCFEDDVIIADKWNAQVLLHLGQITGAQVGSITWCFIMMQTHCIHFVRIQTSEMNWEEWFQNVVDIVLCIYFESCWNSQYRNNCATPTNNTNYHEALTETFTFFKYPIIRYGFSVWYIANSSLSICFILINERFLLHFIIQNNRKFGFFSCQVLLT